MLTSCHNTLHLGRAADMLTQLHNSISDDALTLAETGLQDTSMGRSSWSIVRKLPTLCSMLAIPLTMVVMDCKVLR